MSKVTNLNQFRKTKARAEKREPEFPDLSELRTTPM